ncbi:nucleotide sugar dehydrogenase [Halovivax ruber XH-70]|uniref:UDP-N-acetyl-D-mannosamine dehydrogenase n=1 Tax=Halovivax ruber (strain DSM 18193 / JCM 13892 / XH-70) TaxID=797302 RepID=L0ICD3_HALRX|nr:nucleotide sugar dehydrogenase [Halovivax ruber]AGB15627.1 nucleotide sugar dehydrogenase [Halovivax ruber XH-70]
MKLYDISRPFEDRVEAFRSGSVPVAVYGLGKMGLPLAAVYADTCHNVIGADVDESVVETINEGRSHVKREPGLSDLVSAVVTDGSLRATSDPQSAAADATVHVVIVPTLVDAQNEPDLSVLQSVARDIASGLEAGDIVILESTVPPRTCADVLEPLLVEASGLDAQEFGLAFCPERTASGRALEDIRGAYQKIVGGIDRESTDLARMIYEEINDAGVIAVSDTTTAEAVKVFEGVYRDVNIALANELGTFADDLDIDVTEAIEAANTLPYCNLHTPGAGVGGHCIPYYPHFMIGQFESSSPLMETARSVNDSMPAFTVDKLLKGLNEQGTTLSDATVVVLGLTYRAGVEEIRHAPSLPIVDRLVDQCASVYVVDPILEDFSAFDGSKPISRDEIYDVDPDAAVLVTAHEEFDGIDWEQFQDQLVVVDGRQALDIDGTDHWVYTIGAGWIEQE